MKLRLLLFTGFLALFGHFVQAQCSAAGYISQSGGTTTFYDSSTSANGHVAYWSFGDGSSVGYGAQVSHTYRANGGYTACLYIYDSIANCRDTTCFTVIVTSVNNCNATITYTVDSTNSLQYYFTGSNPVAGGSASITVWDFGSNDTTYNSQNAAHLFPSAGSYRVYYTLYDSTGQFCDSVEYTLTVGGGSAAACDAFFVVSVSGNTVNFHDSTTNSNIIEWSFGDSSYAYTSNPTHTYASAGTYRAYLYIYSVDSVGDTLLCDSFSRSITINATSNCTASFSAHVDSINMSASSFPVDFTNRSTGANYLWNFGDGNTDTSQNPTHIYTSSGTYTVCLYVISTYDSLGLPVICDSTCTSVTVGGYTAPCQAGYYLGIDTANRYNLYIINNSTGTSSTTNYSWSFGDGTTSTAQYPTHQYSTFGLYNLCLTISDSAAGCSSTYCDSIGLDSNGNLLKRDGFGITVVDEKDLLSAATIDLINELSAFPNPTSGVFTMKLNLRASEVVSISAINSLGQEVMATKLNGLSGTNEYRIDMTAQPNGIYFLNVRAGNQFKNLKLYINK